METDSFLVQYILIHILRSYIKKIKLKAMIIYAETWCRPVQALFMLLQTLSPYECCSVDLEGANTFLMKAGYDVVEVDLEEVVVVVANIECGIIFSFITNIDWRPGMQVVEGGSTIEVKSKERCESGVGGARL